MALNMDAHRPLPADLGERSKLIVDKHVDFIVGFAKVQTHPRDATQHLIHVALMMVIAP
jgi:hypothetical protein